MGAISDGSYKKFGYGTGEGQIDIAKQMRLANQGRVTQGEMITRGAVSIFLSLTSKIAESSNNSSSDTNVSEDATPEEIEARREDVLKELNSNSEYNCDCVGDIDALIVEKNSQLNQANAQVTNLTNEIGALEKNISKIEACIEYNDSEVVEDLATELKTMKAELEKKKEELEKTQEIQKTLTTEISNLETAKKALANLDKQLEKANKKDAVKKWDDESTQDIVGLIKKYNEYNAAGKTEKAEKLKNGKLKEAIDAYRQSHNDGDNKTIDNLIAMVNKK